MDVRAAHFNAPMVVDVYSFSPDGIDNAGEEALLLKALYGFKHASRL